MALREEAGTVARPTPTWRAVLGGAQDPQVAVDVVALALTMVLVRLVVTFLLGSAFNTWPARVGWDMHLLDLGAVRAHPVTSLLHLHSQPPLYTVVCAVASGLPGWVATGS